MITLNCKAPDIQLVTDKEPFSLSKFTGKNIVVFFYPKADTSGCTKEAISFTELKSEFDKLDTIIIGISKDTKQIKNWQASIPNLDEMYTCKSYEELENIVNAWLNDDSDTTEDSFEPRNQGTTTTTTSTDSKDPMSKIDEAFADLDF